MPSKRGTGESGTEFAIFRLLPKVRLAVVFEGGLVDSLD